MSTPVTPWEEALKSGGGVLVLVRHGQTAWNAQQRFLGRSDIPLDEVGHAQAKALHAAIGQPFPRLYTSPLARASQTAGYLHPDPQPISDLQELDQGDLEGLSGEEAFRRYPDFFRAWRNDPTAMPCPGGEGLEECQERCWLAARALVAAHPGELVAAVAHQFVIASICCAVTGSSLTHWRKWGVRNTAVTVLTVSGDTWGLSAHDWLPDSAS